MPAEPINRAEVLGLFTEMKPPAEVGRSKKASKPGRADVLRRRVFRVLALLNDLPAAERARVVRAVSQIVAALDEMEAPPADVPTKAKHAPVVSDEFLGEYEQAILGVMKTAPQTAKHLAHVLGRPCNSHFRSALTRLSRMGRVVRTPDGWFCP